MKEKNKKIIFKWRIMLLSVSIFLICIIILLSNIEGNIFYSTFNISKNEETNTSVEFKVIKYNNDSKGIIVTVKNDDGIDKIIMEDSLTIDCKNKSEISFDKTIDLLDIYRISVKGTRESNYTVFGLKPDDSKLYMTEDGDTIRKYRISNTSSEQINYYSIDDGETWTECGEEFQIAKEDSEHLTIKAEIEDGVLVYKRDTIGVGGDLMEFATEGKFGNDEYHSIRVNDEDYDIHTYKVEGDLTISSTTQYGTANDVATASEYAKAMVLLRVEGNLTINSGSTLTTYGTAYGGAKGFFICVTGTITNNGTISMTARGAKAVGQNVYIYQNADGSFEYVPAKGATGGARTSSGCNAGKNGVERQTGGGGSGIGDSYYNYASAGAGATGTSYSGGPGGGGAGKHDKSGYHPHGGDGDPNGGAGGNGAEYHNNGSGGAGNPGGARAGSGASNGANGTGGLLIIYSKNGLNNNNTISSNGTNGGGWTSGGSSGGGSINIFTPNITNNGSITVNGGVGGGAGGKGTINVGWFADAQYVKNTIF